MRTLPYDSWQVTIKLVIINVIVFLMTSVSQNLQIRLAMIPSFILDGWLWQFVTYMFVHSNFEHIFWNMEPFAKGWRLYEVPIGQKEGLTFYTRHPDLFAKLDIIGTILYAIYACMCTKKRKQQEKRYLHLFDGNLW